MFFVLGLSIVLVALLVMINAASLVAVLLWRIFERRIHRWPARRAAQTLFLLRILPAALGVGSVFFLFAPAYLRHELRVGHEDVSVKLAVFAILSAIGIASALVRGIATWRATAGLAAEWLRNGRPIQIPTLKVPAYQVEHPFPLIAVVGAFRPRLFIAKQIFESLTPAELTAALEHEKAHIMAHDNLKRTVVRACRDLVLIPVGRDMERAWLDASEVAADEFAARRDHRIGLDLASAIVKIARMIPDGARPAMTAGAFLASEESTPGFTARVRRLVQLSDNRQPRAADTGSKFQFQRLIPIALTLLLGVMTAESHILSAVHTVIEHAVYLLD